MSIKISNKVASVVLRGEDRATGGFVLSIFWTIIENYWSRSFITLFRRSISISNTAIYV